MRTKYWLGIQTVLFMLLLSMGSITAQNNLIPNTLDCGGTRPPFAFTIKNAWTSNTSQALNTWHTPLAGDIDGDGVTEILCMNYNSSIIYIFDGRTGATIGTVNLGVSVSTSSYVSPMLICNTNGTGKIFVVGQNNPTVRLYEVSSAPGVRPITFNPVWTHSYQTAANTNYSTLPVVADLDGDGTPEFIAGYHIISSVTGLSLAQMALAGTGSWEINFPLTVDLDHDGLPEVVVGTNV